MITHKKWQNLFYGKCPNCGEILETNNGYLICPNAHPEDTAKNCFFIRKNTAIEFLLDEKHAANFCLTKDEKINLEQAVKDLDNL